MQYWVMKGNPRSYDWESNLIPGKVEDWHNTWVPGDLTKGDRIFFWESSPKCRVVGLGVFVRKSPEKDEDGLSVFYVKYLTRRLSWMPDRKLLLKIPELQEASFLKIGPKYTTYDVTDVEAMALYRILLSGNETLNVWEDIEGITTIDGIDAAVVEGGVKLLQHVLRERRNRAIVAQKKSAFCAKHGRLFCECCHVDLAERYGKEADDLCEVHHRRSLSSSEGEVVTTLKDLAILCPNCHRAIHRFSPMISVEKLSTIVKTG
jgi:hypothetical protein